MPYVPVHTPSAAVIDSEKKRKHPQSDMPAQMPRYEPIPDEEQAHRGIAPSQKPTEWQYNF